MWTERDIENGINEIRHAWLLERMPSMAEVKMYYGDCRLTNAISKSGGFRYWAKKMGLEVKDSESQLGYECEMMVMQLLKEQGYDCEKTSIRHPYDLLVNGCVKIDVKVARVSKCRTSDSYSFRLAKPQQTCDVYIAVCLGDSAEPKKTYIIPSHVMTGKKQLTLGIVHSKYDEYIDRWDIIDQFLNAFERIS